ncbi:MAG: hypothetical protein ACTHU0_13870 [Kofleriaceae bacterium]
MTKVVVWLAMAVGVVAASARTARAQVHGCSFDVVSGRPEVTVSATARLVARLVDPPRTRVTLSIDDASTNHAELVWDPAIDDGLQRSLLLQGPAGRVWTFSPSIEDERIQSGQVVVVMATEFAAAATDPAKPHDGLSLGGTRKALLATSTTTSFGTPATLPGKPTLLLSCEEGQVELSSLQLDRKRVASAATARGLLDQAAPAPVVEVLSLLAEIAIERARSGALALLKQKFVEPMCNQLTLRTLGLGGDERAFPATCALLQQLRLDDVLASGRNLVAAARDDLRGKLAPALLDAVIVNDETRELASLALGFANRMIDGEANAVAEIDLLVAFLDHLAWSNGFEQSRSIVLDWLDALSLDAAGLDAIVRGALDRALPRRFWNDPTASWVNVPACRRDYRKLGNWAVVGGAFPNGAYFEPDRAECIDALARSLAGTPRAAITAGLQYFRLEHLVRALRARPGTTLADYLAATYPTGSDDAANRGTTSTLLGLLPAPATPVLEHACAVRLVVGVAKWCSRREACSAGEIAEALDHPRKLFKPSTRLPEALCWTGAAGSEQYRLPGAAPRLIDLATRLVAFLEPPKKGEERARALAMVRWMFAVVRSMNQGAPQVDQIEQIVGHLLEADYLRALTEAFGLAKSLCAGDQRCGELAPVNKALELIGAVASYVQTYEATKSLSVEEARHARKQAIESLIDAATDREGREGDVVYSIGSPVGFAAGLRVAPGSSADYGSKLGAYDGGFGFQWRLPLAITRQRLPGADEICGSHLALWIADLGQFTRTRAPGSQDDITWKDFLGIGVQGGFVLGSSRHSVVLALEASWAPGLYARDVTIRTASTTTTERVAGAFTAGLTLAYYVPFFDLN